MDIILPAREAAEAYGWKYQVQWIEGGNRCFMRFKFGHAADAHADKLRRAGLSPVVIDLRDALQLH